MSELTKLEQAAMEALDNEAIECTREERETFIYQLRAYRNAAIYADMFGFDVDEFRAELTRLTGVTKDEANNA